jgi:BirA family transcriptional regulator, biotin operon repressor / biotin---[acetyl-CoA-carboxylase] ligase
VHTSAPLDVDALRADLLAPAGPWTRLDVVARTGSTNADLLAASAAGAPDRTVLVAEVQEAGRGRLARSWVSPPGTGLTLSVLLRPVPVAPARFGWIPLLAGLAVLDAVRELTALPAALKWPNDLLLGSEGRKAAGILAEVAPDGGVVLGIGFNVGAVADLPEGATSPAAEGVELDRTGSLRVLLLCLAARDAQWRDGGGDPDASRLRSDYRAACASLGTEVRVDLPGGDALTGIAEDVDGDGRLLLLDAHGRRRAVAAGDVVHLRPAF